MVNKNKNRDTSKATLAYMKKSKIEKEKRKVRLLEIIRNQPALTAYSLTKLIGYPLSTIQMLVKELDEELEIKFIVEGKKKKIYIRTIDDFYYTYFNFETIDHPATKRLMKSARAEMMDITFRMENRSEHKLQPTESIEQFKKRLLN